MQKLHNKQNWVIDPVHSKISFSARYLLITQVSGWFTQIEGTVQTEREDFTDAAIRVTIFSSSVNTANEERDKHLRSTDFLDAKQYPQIVFESTSVAKAGDNLELKGILRIKEAVVVTSFTVKHTGTTKDQYGNTKAGFEMTTTFIRKDLDLGWNRNLGNKSFLISNDVFINADIQLLLIK